MILLTGLPDLVKGLDLRFVILTSIISSNAMQKSEFDFPHSLRVESSGIVIVNDVGGHRWRTTLKPSQSSVVDCVDISVTDQ
ncbi:hypothetical protein L484_006429 [Morus notabilis]|uniref:Uncharacterized protein n=1 Tax=Morus notabilis TaxID=981085 RepID=W9RMT6_9ROSA|nr:hypothetical protein L484_006429 [Morus notabilis]